MEKLLLCIIGILLFIIFVLLAKICFLRKSAQEIAAGFHDRLAIDTNTLIDISTRDRYMRKLARDINEELRLLRGERHRYQHGDLELKEAIPNISHDLRTPLTAISGYLDLLEREEKSMTVQRYISQIQNRTEALKNLTEELFRYSVITSTKELRPEEMDVVRALEENLLSFYAVMQEKDIQPEIELPEDPNVTDKKFKGNPTKSYRTKYPLKIVAEAINWKGHSPEVLQAMLDNLRKIEAAGMKAIE